MSSVVGTNPMNAQQFVLSLFFLVLAGWSTLWLLARRLNQVFPEVWSRLGGPKGYPAAATNLGESWRNWKANLYLTIFVWRPEYIDLRDRRVTVLVWCMRLVYVLIAIFAVVTSL